MSINSIFSSTASVRFTRAHAATSTASTDLSLESGNTTRNALISLRDSITDLLGSLNQSSTVLASARASITNEAASTNSTSDIGLSTEGTATTMSSADEVNTTPTSFSPFGPDWDDSSTSELTVSGTYDGSRGDTELRIRARRSEGGHEIGEDRIQIRIRDNDTGTTLETFWIEESDPPGTEYTTTTGLVLSFSAGTLRRNADAYVDVYDTVDSEIDADKPLNGVRNDNPNLEDGFAVTAGSFDVNGETIAVAAADTVNDVLQRINDSAAGVTAAYDAGTEQVTLTQETLGSEATIVLENDTSGFLAAMKLDTASQVLGMDSEAEVAMDQVAEFASVTSGSILVNGESVVIDVTSDSLQNVVDRITASDAGVRATLSADAQTVTLQNLSASADLVLDSNGTAFFEALNITEDTYEPVEVRGVTESRAETASEAVIAFAEAFNALYDDSRDGLPASSFLTSLRQDLQLAVADQWGTDGPRFNTTYGIAFNFTEGNDEVMNFGWAAQNRMESLLRTGGTGADVYELFLGGTSSVSEGLQERITGVLEAMQSDLNTMLGPVGTFLDIWL